MSFDIQLYYRAGFTADLTSDLVLRSAESFYAGKKGHQMLIFACPGDLQVIDQSAVIMLLTAQSAILILVN